MRTPAGSFCKAGVRFFCARPTGRFCKAGARLLRPTGRRSSPFVRRPRASIHRPQRPALPPACPTRAHASFPLVMAPFPQPLHALPSARAHSPFRFFRFPRPAPPSSALPYRAPGRCARLPLRRPSFPAPFPDTARLHRKGKRCPHQCGAPRGIPARAAGLTRRGCGPGFRACVARFCGLPRAGGDEDGGATVAAGHKTGLPRGRGAGIRRNGRRNRQAGPMRRWAAGVRPRLPCLRRSLLRSAARERGGWRRNGRCRHKAGLPRAVGGWGAAPASVLASFDFAACRAREGRVAAQQSLPDIKPACRAGGARVSAGMVGKIVRPAR